MANLDKGMNIEEIEAFGHRLQDHYAAELRSIAVDLNRLVGGSPSQWRGNDADGFRSWWPTKKQRILAVAEDLHGFGQSALNNASEQRIASGEAIAQPIGPDWTSAIRGDGGFYLPRDITHANWPGGTPPWIFDENHGGPFRPGYDEMPWAYGGMNHLHDGIKIGQYVLPYMLNTGNPQALEWISVEAMSGSNAALGGASGAMGAAGNVLTIVNTGQHSVAFGNSMADGDVDGMVRSGLDIGFDLVGTTIPIVGVGKAAWDTGYLVGDLISDHIVGDSFVDYNQAATQNRLYGTTDLSGAEATDYAHRYDGVSGFVNFAGDTGRDVAGSLSRGVKGVGHLFGFGN